MRCRLPGVEPIRCAGNSPRTYSQGHACFYSWRLYRIWAGQDGSNFHRCAKSEIRDFGTRSPKIRFCRLGYAISLTDALRGDAAAAAHRRRLYRRARLSSAALIRHQSFSLRFAFSDGLRKNDQRIANVPVTIRLLPLFAPRYLDGPHRSGIVSRRSTSEREPCSK